MAHLHNGITAALITAGTLLAAQNEDRYYLTVLAYQDSASRVRDSHTFAVFTKVSGNAEKSIDNQTISWLPADLDVKVLRLRPEPGKNMSLKATLDLARSRQFDISVWGPFAIKKELYDLALRRIAALNSSKFAYQALDARRGNGGINCIHAVSDLDPSRRTLDTGRARGDAASALVVEHLRPWFLPSKEDTSWLRKQLGLGKRP